MYTMKIKLERLINLTDLDGEENGLVVKIISFSHYKLMNW